MYFLTKLCNLNNYRQSKEIHENVTLYILVFCVAGLNGIQIQVTSDILVKGNIDFSHRKISIHVSGMLAGLQKLIFLSSFCCTSQTFLLCFLILGI
jgi:hypothetical protein